MPAEDAILCIPAGDPRGGCDVAALRRQLAVAMPSSHVVLESLRWKPKMDLCLSIGAKRVRLLEDADGWYSAVHGNGLVRIRTIATVVGNTETIGIAHLHAASPVLPNVPSHTSAG